jgi:hypothetical protein
MSDSSTWSCANDRDKRRVVAVMKFIISLAGDKQLNLLGNPPAPDSGERAKWRSDFKETVSDLETTVMFHITNLERVAGIMENAKPRQKKALVSAISNRLDEIAKAKKK